MTGSEPAARYRMAFQVTPFLMFEGNAEEALNFYMELFEDSSVDQIERYGEEDPDSAGSVKQARFTLGNQQIMCFNSPSPHGFTFTPSFSFYVETKDADQLDQCFAALSEGGEVMMPLDAYDFSPRFAWVQDRFGVSWQLTLVPS